MTPVRHGAARVRRTAAFVLGAGFLFLGAGGLYGYLRPAGPPAASAWAGPAFLWLAALLTLLGARTLRDAGFLLFAGGAGFAAELLGVRFGFPFGHYEYGAALGPAWRGVPLSLFAAWGLLAGYVADRTAGFGRSRRTRALLGAAWLTGFDFLLDPLAAGRLGYWSWPAGGFFHGIPASNFAGWFLVSLVLLAAAPRRFSLRPPARWVGRGLLSFFCVLALGFRLWAPAAAGVLCLAVDAMLSAPPGGAPGAGREGGADVV